MHERLIDVLLSAHHTHTHAHTHTHTHTQKTFMDIVTLK